jgi:hypothetical protein
MTWIRQLTAASRLKRLPSPCFLSQLLVFLIQSLGFALHDQPAADLHLFPKLLIALQIPVRQDAPALPGVT